MSQPQGLLGPPTAPLVTAEARLRARVEEIEALYQDAPVALCLVDRELRFLRVNRLMAFFNGRSVEEHVGRRMQDVLPEAARGPALALARRVLETGEAVHNAEVHTRSERDPAQEHWWLVSCQPVRVGERVDGLVTVVQNVTSLRRAEDEARRQGAELAALYETAPAGIGLVDPELRYVRVNERLAEMNGLAAHDHAGRPVADLVPELPAHVLEAARRSLATGEPVNGVEYSIRSRSQPGRERSFLASIAPIRTAGVVTGGVCVIEDVTSLKQAERLALGRFAELEIVKERLAEAERLAGVGSWAWDLLADTVWWSDSLFVLFGKERFVPDANSFWDLVHPDDRPAIRRQWEATSQRGEPYWVEFRIVLDDGSERWLRAIAVLERTPDGAPARLAGTCQLLPGKERPRAPGPRR